MAHCTVIGSGPSGLHFALSALARGYSVEMFDVGYHEPDMVNPDDSLEGLKQHLADPAGYFLGEDFSGVLLPGEQEAFYSIPPAKQYALRQPPNMPLQTRRFAPMMSYARGGLAQMWTGGCYPFNAAELVDFPLPAGALDRYYSLIAQRIGVNGLQDDLASAVPLHGSMQEPLQLDEHSALLLERYRQQRELLQNRFGCRMGRARQAVLSRDLGERKACVYCGRCIWGCPTGALYTPAGTLDECLAHPDFRYHGNTRVNRFQYDANGRIRSLQVSAPDGSAASEIPVDTLVLAAGALGSTRLYLESVYHHSGEVIRLPGLMDNRQVLVPFITPRMTGRVANPDSYQYNQLAMGLESGRPEHYVHCLVTTLTTAMLHPVIATMPFDLHTAQFLFRNLHAALGVVNMNFHDTRRDDCYATLDVAADPQRPELVLNYQPPADEARRIAHTLRRLRKVLRRLGSFVPPGMSQVRPMGASVHYAGTLPMSVVARPHSVSPDCQSHDFPNLYIADGASYPFLPAKNITFTLMANAARVADALP